MRVQVPQELSKIFQGELPRPIPLSFGSRVMIIKTTQKGGSYAGKYEGYTGTIARVPTYLNRCGCNDIADVKPDATITIGVVLDGKNNERSAYNCFWFKPEELDVIHATNTEQENSEMLLLKGYKNVSVNIPGHGDCYVASYESDLVEGAPVVVTNGEEYKVGTVIAVDVSQPYPPRWQIVCVIDDSKYAERNRKAKRARVLESQLQDAVKEYQQVALYEMLAEKVPAINDMLKELKEITNV